VVTLKTRSLFSIDILLILSTLMLITIGIMFIYSSGVSSSGVLLSKEYVKQIIWAVIGIMLVLGILFLRYDRFKELSPYIYLVFIFLLLVTLIFGKRVNGAKSWLGIMRLGIQPSEFMKIAAVLFLSAFFERRQKQIGELGTFLPALAIVMLPVALILLQPDLGTAIVFIPIFLMISFVAGGKVHHVFFIILVGILTAMFIILPAWESMIAQTEIPILKIVTEPRLVQYAFIAGSVVAALALVGYFVMKRRYFYWIIYGVTILVLSLGSSILARMVLREFQIMRLVVFLDPQVDPRGAGWHIIQSITAVGSGGLSGKGFLQGTQSHYQFLPQQSTDFIFSIIAEEWGFLGGIFIFMLYMTIIFRGFFIAYTIKDFYAKLVATGILTIFAFHFFINIGMAMGIMPITGIPLLLISYGGSSLLTAMIGIGLLLSIYQNKYS
jgi:rod shape determining protein RodA